MPTDALSLVSRSLAVRYQVLRVPDQDAGGKRGDRLTRLGPHFIDEGTIEVLRRRAVAGVELRRGVAELGQQGLDQGRLDVAQALEDRDGFDQAFWRDDDRECYRLGRAHVANLVVRAHRERVVTERQRG